MSSTSLSHEYIYSRIPAKICLNTQPQQLSAIHESRDLQELCKNMLQKCLQNKVIRLKVWQECILF